VDRLGIYGNGHLLSLFPFLLFLIAASLSFSEDAWLQSIKCHTKSRKWDGHEIVYGEEEATGNEDAYLDAYRNHTDSARQFFASQGQVGRL
jgi:hypothetical protein